VPFAWWGRKERSPLLSKVPGRSLLIRQNSVSPKRQISEAGTRREQVKNVSRHFSGRTQEIIEQENATPERICGHSERYSVIHFVSSRNGEPHQSLDSAIVLSRPGVAAECWE